VELNVNGQTYEVEVSADDLLLWVLRDTIGLTGTKFGCGIGVCGSCSVHIDGMVMRSCITPAAIAVGKTITTIEGLATVNDAGEEVLHPVQEAFIEHQVPQCSWCMSGQMMTAAAFLESNPTPNDDDIIAAMSNNTCRCGTYVRIRSAVARAAQIAEDRA